MVMRNRTAAAVATLPFIADVARGPHQAARTDPALAHGFNCVAGVVTNAAVAEALGRPAVELTDVLAG